jgi:membrane protein required for colicin V production
MILGVYLSGQFSGELADWLSAHVFKQSAISMEWMKIISFVIIFIIVALFVGLIGTLMAKVVQATTLEVLDKILGIVFGVAEASLLVCLLVYLVNSINDLTHFIPSAKISESKLYPWFLNLFNAIFPYLAGLIH